MSSRPGLCLPGECCPAVPYCVLMSAQVPGAGVFHQLPRVFSVAPVNPWLRLNERNRFLHHRQDLRRLSGHDPVPAGKHFPLGRGDRYLLHPGTGRNEQGNLFDRQLRLTHLIGDIAALQVHELESG